MLCLQLRLFTGNFTLSPEAGCEALVGILIFKYTFSSFVFSLLSYFLRYFFCSEVCYVILVENYHSFSYVSQFIFDCNISLRCFINWHREKYICTVVLTTTLC